MCVYSSSLNDLKLLPVNEGASPHEVIARKFKKIMDQASLHALRSIVGDEPSDEILLQLLRDNSVEAAANRFFDGTMPALERSSAPPPPPPPPLQGGGGKRAAACASAREGKHQRLLSSATAAAAVPAPSAELSSAAVKPAASAKPLAERMRPSNLDQLLGQLFLRSFLLPKAMLRNQDGAAWILARGAGRRASPAPLGRFGYFGARSHRQWAFLGGAAAPSVRSAVAPPVGAFGEARSHR